MDCYSDLPIIAPMDKGTTANHLIAEAQKYLSKQQYQMCCEQTGSTICKYSFQDLLYHWGILHKKSMRYYSQSIGKVEAIVKEDAQRSMDRMSFGQVSAMPNPHTISQHTISTYKTPFPYTSGLFTRVATQQGGDKITHSEITGGSSSKIKFHSQQAARHHYGNARGHSEY